MTRSNFRLGLMGISLLGAIGAYGAAIAQSPAIAPTNVMIAMQGPPSAPTIPTVSPPPQHLVSMTAWHPGS